MNQDLINQAIQELTKLRMEFKLLPKRMEALESLILAYGGKVPADNQTTVNITPVQTYPSNGSVASKILFYLHIAREATSKDMFDYIVSHEGITDERDKEILYGTVRQIASNLKAEGTIQGKKEGVKNIYYL